MDSFCFENIIEVKIRDMLLCVEMFTENSRLLLKKCLNNYFKI